MFHTFIRNLLFFGLIISASCTYYKRDILFKAKKEKNEEFFKNGTQAKVGHNYVISKGDYIEFQIFTNKGEILVDPTSEFAKQISGASGASSGSRIKYLVQSDGRINLPILGMVKIDSLTNHQCDSVLSKLYSKYYLEPYIISKVLNRRVFVLGTGGSAGGGAQGSSGGGAGARVVLLENENISLVELLAQVGGPSVYSHANRIKIIRGDLKNPLIMSFDLTHWDSFQKSEMTILPNDIVYIEPGRRRTFDFLRDVATLTTFVSTFFTIFLLTKL